jgi:AraC family transcriptional regulator
MKIPKPSIPAFPSLPLGLPPRVQMLGAHSRHGVRKKREIYRLHTFWCLNLFYQGEGTLTLQNKEYPFRIGCAGFTPPDCDISYHFKQETAVSFIYFLPQATARQISVPVLVDLGHEFETILLDLQSMATTQNADPECVEARTWDILWKVARHSSLAPAHLHAPVIEETLELIERQLSQPIYVQSLAATLNISHTHLNRLFNREFQMSVNRYIKMKRVERARHLLKNSSLPIQSIGAQVGIPDPHLFNKIIHQELGASPRKIREGTSLVPPKMGP